MSSSNNSIEITFPDGASKEYASGVHPLQIANGISPGLAKRAIAAKINDRVVGLEEPVDESGEIQILTFDDDEGKDVFWHSNAHLMAQAVKRLFPEAELGIGPPIMMVFIMILI